jgi:hypothetical protein
MMTENQESKKYQAEIMAGKEEAFTEFKCKMKAEIQTVREQIWG